MKHDMQDFLHIGVEGCLTANESFELDTTGTEDGGLSCAHMADFAFSPSKKQDGYRRAGRWQV